MVCIIYCQLVLFFICIPLKFIKVYSFIVQFSMRNFNVMKYPHDSWYACIFFPSYLSKWLHLRKFSSYFILDFVWDATVSVHNIYWGSCSFIAYRTDIPLFFYMEDNFTVSITEASYCNSPVVMYIHPSATAVMPYISSYSIYMVGVTDKFHFFYFYIFYFRSECGKIILHKYKFFSYVILPKTWYYEFVIYAIFLFLFPPPYIL